MQSPVSKSRNRGLSSADFEPSETPGHQSPVLKYTTSEFSVVKHMVSTSEWRYQEIKETSWDA